MSSPGARLARALGALGLLVAMVIGVPVLLAALHLVPHSLPSIYEVGHVLSTRDNGQLLRVVLAAGAWFSWGLFTASTMAEAIALLRSRPTVPVRGLGVFQQSAAALLATIALGLTMTSAASTVAAVNATARPPLPVATVVDTRQENLAPAAVGLDRPSIELTSTGQALVPAPTYEVVRRDTLWALAERFLGNPLRYPEIVELNSALIGADNRIVPGAVLVMPGDASGLPTHVPGTATAPTADVIVEPGDTLWTIAEEATGDGEDWGRVWAANQGRAESGGAVFDDPDLIRPGWTLTVPTSAGQIPDTSTVPTPAQPPTQAEPSPAPAPEPPPSTSATATPPSTVPAPSTMSRPSQTPDGPMSEEAGSPNHVAHECLAVLSPALTALAGGGALLAGVSLMALTLYRRQQFRRRRPGQFIRRTPAELILVERALLAAGTVDVSWLDRALRSLVQQLASVQEGALPDVIAVCMTDDVLTLVLTHPARQVPEPWTVDDTGTRWSVHRDDRLDYDEDRRSHFLAPFPALASIGYTDEGERWLLDLERVGVAVVAGDFERGADLLRFLAAELAHNTWSEMLRITATGIGPGLAPLNPDRLTCDEDVEAAGAAVTRQQAVVLDAMRIAETDVLAGRLHDIAGDTWAPHVFLVAAATDEAGTVSNLMSTTAVGAPRSGVAVVLATGGEVSEGIEWRMTIDAAGELNIPALGLRIRAQQLPPEEAGQLAQMLSLAASEEDASAALARGDDLIVASGDVPLDDVRYDGPPPRPDDQSASTMDSVLPMSESAYLTAAATTARDVRVLAPVPVEGARQKVERGDPHLDRDLADWTSATSPRPKLTLLGPVRVRAQSKLPQRNPRRQFYTEVVAYLATRIDGATSERFATAMWPNEPDVIGKTKVRQAISVVRAWLGTAPETGADYLPSGLTAAAAGRYRINDVLVDAQLFDRLRVRGLARGREGIGDLEAALGLVTGRPFEIPEARMSGAGGYGWLVDADSRLDHEYAAMIVDVAHVVATHHLGAGEPQLAATAARLALRSGTYEDVPLLDLVAACDAVGNRAEADTYVARILANHDAEVEEDLPPRTAAILHRRQRARG